MGDGFGDGDMGDGFGDGDKGDGFGDGDKGDGFGGGDKNDSRFWCFPWLVCARVQGGRGAACAAYGFQVRRTDKLITCFCRSSGWPLFTTRPAIGLIFSNLKPQASSLKPHHPP